jgi:hypothetical protein
VHDRIRIRLQSEKAEDSSAIRERILIARQRQFQRLSPFAQFCNTQMTLQSGRPAPKNRSRIQIRLYNVAWEGKSSEVYILPLSEADPTPCTGDMSVGA